MSWVVPLLLLLVVWGPMSLSAQEKNQESLLNKLFAPGPLLRGHDELEHGDCLKCHDAGEGVPDAKCLDCHKEIRVYVEEKRGYHGLQLKNCKDCHADHKGREYDAILFDPKNFDHASTGYRLSGKHGELKCAECHNAKRGGKSARPGSVRYLGATTSCRECHLKEDVHFFRGDWAKADCNECHGLEGWDQGIRFDHLRDGNFKLEGAHAKSECADCHVLDKKTKRSQYEWPNFKSQQCLSCHQDVHKTNLSPKFRNGQCTSCHNQEEWKIKRFDHGKATQFALRGKHLETKCTECHVSSPSKDPKKPGLIRYVGLGEACLDCHHDFHFFGKLKTKKYGELNHCEECHNEVKWSDTHDFSHNRNTRYLVDGKHLELDCLQCHVDSLRQKGQKALPFKDDLKAQFWLNPQARDRQLPSQYHWAKLESKTCENCHENVHRKTFSAKLLKKACTDCHVTSSWKDRPRGVKFNHDATQFKLTDEHAKLKCAQCHVVNKKEVFKFSSKDLQFCVDCHRDPHEGQLSDKTRNQSCANCHDAKSFIKIKPFDHQSTSYPLKGEHREVKCKECHSPTSEKFPFKPNHRKHQFLFPDLKNKDCAQCHVDIHQGQLKSKKCSDCHSEEQWKKISFDHNQDSRYKLLGEHRELKCQECHFPGKDWVRYKDKKLPVVRYRPLDQDCNSCHSKDDKHKDEMGQKCGSCHREDDWKTVKDFHRNYTLQGVHYTLQCAECHDKEGRKLSGLSDQCLICHQKDDVHNSTLPACQECHRQSFWEDSQFRHSLSPFPLRGVHRTLDCANCHTGGVYQGTKNTCYLCHQSDASAVSSPPHLMPNFMDCAQCHNQFTFSGAN